MDEKAQKTRDAILEAIAKHAERDSNAQTVERLAHAYAMTVSANPASVENAYVHLS